MPKVTVRDVPRATYAVIKAVAHAQRLSVNDQLLAILDEWHKRLEKIKL